MILVEIYIFRVVLAAFFATLAALTSGVWLAQAIREFDLLTRRWHYMTTWPRSRLGPAVG